MHLLIPITQYIQSKRNVQNVILAMNKVNAKISLRSSFLGSEHSPLACNGQKQRFVIKIVMTSLPGNPTYKPNAYSL